MDKKHLLQLAEILHDALRRNWIVSFPNVVINTCKGALPLLESLDV